MMLVFLEHGSDLRLGFGLIILRNSLVEEGSNWMIYVLSFLHWSQLIKKP